MEFIFKKSRWIAVIGILSIYVFGALIGIGCPVKFLTGIPCLACGMTRAYTQLLHLDIAQAFFYHPLFFLVPFGIYFVLRYENRRDHLSKYAVAFLLVLFFIVYCIRLIGGSSVVRIELRDSLFYRVLQAILRI